MWGKEERGCVHMANANRWSVWMERKKNQGDKKVLLLHALRIKSMYPNDGMGVSRGKSVGGGVVGGTRKERAFGKWRGER